MKLLYFVPALAVLGLFLPSHADSEEDTLQEWIDYVDEYRQYMEEYRQWASDRFEYYESQISELTSQLDEKSQYVQELEERVENLVGEREEDSINHINNEPETTPSNGMIGDNPPVSPLPDQASVSNADAEVQFAVGSTNPSCADTNDCFVPYEVTVDVGGEVTWSNPDNLSTQSLHTLTNGEITDDTVGDMFNSVLVQPGQMFSYKFEEAGTYPYFCFVHPWMVGTVVVIDDSVEVISIPDNTQDPQQQKDEHAPNSNTQTNTNSDNSEDATESTWKKGGHITTRNQNYTLGDVIHITGNTDFPEQRNLKGEIIHHDHYALRVVIKGIDKYSLSSEINCSNNGQTPFSCSPYGSDGFTLNLIKYNDDGTFFIEAKVEENAIAGKYTLMLVYNWSDSGGPIVKSWKYFSIIPPN